MKIYFSIFSRFNAIFPAARDPNFQAEEEDISFSTFKQHALYATVIWNCVKMKMIILFCYDATRRCSDESCFIFEMHLLVDHRKILVSKALLKCFFSVEAEPSTSFCLNEQHS